MPYVLRPPIRKLGIVASLAASAIAFVAFPAIASADCDRQPSQRVFSTYGDEDLYTLVPGGDFDFGTPNWSLQAALLDSGDALKPNQAPHLKYSKTPKSLKINKGGSAYSATVCVDALRPTFRFFAFKKSGAAGNLDVRLQYSTSFGQIGIRDVATLGGKNFASWKIGPKLPLSTALPLNWELGESAQVRLVFDFADSASAKGQWLIDELYVDPYRR